MNKVYLVYSYSGFEEYPRVEFVCSSYKTAEKKKSEIEQRIQNIKTQYYLEHSSDYDKDYKYILGDDWINDSDEVFDEKANFVYRYQSIYEELDIRFIKIEKKILCK